MRMTRIFTAIASTVLATQLLCVNLSAQSTPGNDTNVAVAPQYDTTHVYVAPEDFDRFVASLIATFGGTTAKQGVFTVTPTASSTISQLVLTPGYLVTDMNAAIREARATGADVLVTPYDDPIGKDTVIQFPGGVNTQLYWHTTPPAYAPLQTIPENRVYVSADRAEAFVRSFLAFAHGRIVSDEAHAPGVEIGRPNDNYRRIRIESKFGKLTVSVTDGHLPYPYGRELTGYEVADLRTTLEKAKAAGVQILVPANSSDHRDSAIVQFPGGYIAEIHSASKPNTSR